VALQSGGDRTAGFGKMADGHKVQKVENCCPKFYTGLKRGVMKFAWQYLIQIQNMGFYVRLNLFSTFGYES
jgi:hypothetical protein